MKIYGRLLLILSFISYLNAQDTSDLFVYSKFKVSFSYGFCIINPKEINDHIANINTISSSNILPIKTVPEISCALIFRPSNDNKLILLRIGYIAVERKYQVSIPETIDTTIITGYTNAKINEEYSSYPISIGAGFCSSTFKTQLQLEFIYGIGYIKETQRFTLSSGLTFNSRKSLYSPSYGFRLAGNTAVPLTKNLDITFEASYRYLVFREYLNETTSQYTNIIFSFSGISFSVGLSLLL